VPGGLGVVWEVKEFREELFKGEVREVGRSESNIINKTSPTSRPL